jgi:iron complex outermembrane receptor protein
VLYGQAELGGIVNVVSKRPQATASREIELQLGSYQRKQAALDFTGPLSEDKQWQYRLVALVREANTQVDHVNDDALLLMPSISWQPSSDTKITAQLVHQRNDSKVSAQFLPFKGTLGSAPLGQIPASRFVGEPDWDRYEMRKTELTLAVEQQLAADWKLLASARQTDSESLTREIWATVGAIPSDAGDISRTVHAADRATDVFLVDARVEGGLRWGPTRHQLVIGVDRQSALWEEFNYFNRTGVGSFNLYKPVYGATPGLDLNALPLTDRPDNRIVQTGLYLSDHMRWGPWIVSGAWRRDQARNELLPVSGAATVVRNSASTGRLGLMFQFDNGLAPYLSWADAFIPNLGTDGTPAAGFLKPTTGRQQEAGLKYLAESGNTLVNLAWFDIEQQNRIVDGSTPGGREQVGAFTRGWEIDARQRFGALELMAQYTQMKARNAVTGLRLSSIAEKNASAWAQYQLGGGWRVGAGLRKVGSVTGNASNPVAPSVTLIDAMVGVRLADWDLRLDAKNLADKTYVSWCRGANQDCGYGELRQINLTARYRF